MCPVAQNKPRHSNKMIYTQNLLIFVCSTPQMIKRTLAICFLFLAGITLVGHAIFPHHHHIKVCEFVSETVSHNHEHDYLTPFSHSHQHEGSSAPHCVLEQTVIIRSGISRIQSPVVTLSSANGDSDSGLILSGCLNNEQYQYIPESGIFRYSDYQLQTCFKLFQFIKLRGPPAA